RGQFHHRARDHLHSRGKLHHEGAVAVEVQLAKVTRRRFVGALPDTDDPPRITGAAREHNSQGRDRQVSHGASPWRETANQLAYFRRLGPGVGSIISFGILGWRVRLYTRVGSLIRSPAFSVAAFMATRRAICSLTAASRKHLKSRTLNATGTSSSRMS